MEFSVHNAVGTAVVGSRWSEYSWWEGEGDNRG